MAFHPFRLFRGHASSSYLGVDIGTTSIKIAEVRRGKQMPRLANYAFLEAGDHVGRENSALQTSTLKIFDKEVIELLRAVIGRMKPHADTVLASLPLFSVFFANLTFPEMTAEELGQSLVYQARQYIPLPLSEVQLEWLKVGEFEDERGYKQQQVLLISTPQEHIERYQYIFGSVGLRLKVLEIESLSLGRALVGGDPTPTAVVDIGSRSTCIAFFEKGKLKFNAQSDFAGASLTQALASSLNINARRAEELKREKGIVASGAEYELSTILLPFLDVIINEVKKAQFAYQSQFPSAPGIERVILSGGSANLKGIEKYVGRELNVPVIRAAPFVRFEYPSALEPVVNELNSTMSVALGLAQKEFASQ